jgi:hypothetical protein
MPALASDDTLLDRLAIRDLVELYADRLNHADWDGYKKLLIEDFEFYTSAPANVTIRGRDNMMKLVREAYKSGFVHQMAHNIIVDRVVGDRARARHTLHVLSDKFQLVALYYDGVVRTADGWKFARRDCQVTYYENGPLPGGVHRKLPDPGKPVWYEEFAKV